MGNSYVRLYWAKTAKDGSWHPVAYHSLDVAASVVELLRQRPGLLRLLAKMLEMSEEDTLRLVAWMVALHDIGKYSRLFQHKSPPFVHTITGQLVERQYGYAHADGSMAFWNAHKSALLKGAPPFAEIGLTVLFRGVAGHHGAPVEDIDLGGAGLIDPHDDMMRFAADCTEIFKPVFPRIKKANAQRASWLLAGITVLADWIGSNSEWFPYAVRCSCEVNLPLDDPATYWTGALVKARRAVAAAGMASVPLRHDLGLRGMFPEIATPTPLQAALGALEFGGPGLCIVEDLTGSGKTEAALSLAQRMIAAGHADGVYIALPTSATSNGMYARLAVGKDGDSAVYRKMFAADPQPSLVLAHGDRILNTTYNDSVMWSGREVAERYAGEEETGGAACSGWIADMARKALLADVGVGTIDQALLAVLPNKYQSIRLAGLAGKVVILDEIHCYDSYMTAEICGLLRFLGMLRCPIIALSATLPKALRQQLLDAYRDGAGWPGDAQVRNDAYPLITWMEKDRPVLENETGFREGAGLPYPIVVESNVKNVVNHLIAAAEDGCACWVRNTVDDAREAVALLQKEAPHISVMLFHSRYCSGDRAGIEGEVLRLFGKDSSPADRRRRIVVATQVVEQSLDLDFDAMVTDLAPMEAVIQRAGRLQRHRRGKRHVPKVLMVYAPPPSVHAGADWFSSFLPRASRVYPIHAQLWLTAKVLAAMGDLDLRDNSRMMIESVYGDASSVPEPIVSRDARHITRLVEEGVLGQVAVLNHREGYDKAAGQWDSDIRTPTRLGDPERPVRLAVLDGNGNIVPWSRVGPPYQRWIRSTLTLPYHWMTDIDQWEEHAEQIDRIRARWPRHERTVPLIVADNRDVLNIVGMRDNTPAHIRYTPDLGAERVL